MAIFHNYVLIATLTAWAIAQLLKVPIEYLETRRWNWALLVQAGGMPSSHSSLIVAATHGIGLSMGFDSALFALAFAMAMIVIYDATGIRRQAGKHAELINAMINDLAAGHPLKEEQLREVLGHTPMEALGGIFLGLIVAQLTWMVWVK
jgi:acid phosphatase family membrane protein YuiD